MIRLHVGEDLAPERIIALGSAQSHYLLHVMRRGGGDEVRLFNGRDGEWRARLVGSGDAGAASTAKLRLEAQTRAQVVGPDLELIIALIKKPRLEIVVEKAAELGAATVRLMVTARTAPGHANLARLTSIAVEAAEQTGRLDAPRLEAPAPLTAILETWPSDRTLIFCDEAGDAPPMLEALASSRPGAWAVMIGPEGGFSAAERSAIRALPQAAPVSLGPRVLRADTAAIAALTLWQGAAGDWRGA